jgi:type I restriction enzyme S subunit
VWGYSSEDGKPGSAHIVRVFRVSDVKDNYTLAYDDAPTRAVSESQARRYALTDGNIVVVKSSGSNTRVISGRCALFQRPNSDDVFIPSNFTFAIKCSVESIDPAFLYFWLRSPRMVKLVEKFAEGSTYPNLKKSEYEKIPVVVPPLAEQRQIAAVLSAVQRAIERQERLIALTAELKKALMHKLFTEGTRGELQKQQTRFGPVPASWNVVALGECCQVQTGIAKGRKVNADDAITVPYLRVANVQDGRLDLTEVKLITIRKSEFPRFSLCPGDVVLTEGGDLDKLGRGFIWNGQVAECVHQNHIFAVRPDPSRLSSEFIAYQTQSTYGKRYFLSVAHKTTNLACINTSKLKAFPVLLPTGAEQKEIVTILQLLDRRQSIAVDTLVAMRSLFRTLLHQLMTAQVRVHDLDLSALEGAARASSH